MVSTLQKKMSDLDVIQMQLKNVMRYKTEELLGTYNAMQSAKNALSTGMFYASITILWIIVISYAVGTLYFLILAI